MCRCVLVFAFCIYTANVVCAGRYDRLSSRWLDLCLEDETAATSNSRDSSTLLNKMFPKNMSGFFRLQLNWLNDTSEVVYFNKEGLDEFVIMHPLKLMDAVKLIVRYVSRAAFWP